MPGIYNPFEHPRATRASLPLPPLAEMRHRLDEIREKVLERLERTDLDDANPLLAGGYVYNMVLQHEYQHNETILQTLQLKLGEPYHPPVRASIPNVSEAARPLDGTVEIPAGEYAIGTTDRSAAYDNERPQHAVSVAGFRIDRTAVTNRAYIEFISAGGYNDSRLWSDAGRGWLAESGASSPKHWNRDGNSWTVRTMDRITAVDPHKPVCHVCYHEADAFARWPASDFPPRLNGRLLRRGIPLVVL